MRQRPFIAAALVAVSCASLTSCFREDPLTQRYTYTGTVVAVCSHETHHIPDCFAMTPDPGTAYRDGYYAGGGAVSFGRPPADRHIPRLEDHLVVTVVTSPNRTTVVEVTPVPVS
jgi:hypothetical protein